LIKNKNIYIKGYSNEKKINMDYCSFCSVVVVFVFGLLFRTWRNRIIHNFNFPSAYLPFVDE